MIKTHRLSDAQAAVLSGDVEYSASGHVAVTTGRENTLASLRKLGLLNGLLLTRNGNNARVTAQAGECKITISEDGTDTFYLTRECTEGHPVEAGTEVNAVGMCMPCVREGQARIKAEYAANLVKWQQEADAKRAEEDATMHAQSVAMETALADILAGYSEVTDADLDALAARGSGMAPGPIREAEILRPLTPRVRALVRAEGMVWMNTTPGWDWSGSLWEARKNVLSGRTPGRELNARLMAHDPTGERAADAAANGRGWDGFMADAHTVAPVEPTADVCPNCTQSHPADDVELHAAPCFVCASDGHAGCQHGDDAPAPFEKVTVEWAVAPADRRKARGFSRVGTATVLADDPTAVRHYHNGGKVLRYWRVEDAAAQRVTELDPAAWVARYATSTCEHGNDGSTECALCIAWDDAPAQTHVIKFVGMETTMCGEPVQQSMGTLRVSVDPSDATCAQCIASEAELAALDAVQPDDDAADHREAIKAAQDAETAAQAAPGYPRQTADGRTVWACCESSIGAPCQHRTGARDAGVPMVVIEPSRTDRRKVVAWLVGLNTPLHREFRADRSMPLHVAFWAQGHGVRPVDGRKFKWQKHETLSLAPARI